MLSKALKTHPGLDWPAASSTMMAISVMLESEQYVPGTNTKSRSVTPLTVHPNPA